MRPRSTSLLAIASVGLLLACDPVKVESPQTTQTSEIKPPPTKEPFAIEPKVWGDAGEAAAYEVRELPDGRPGLFTAEGALLFHLMPELILDVGPAGERRRKPQRKSFDLIRLTPHEDGGFSLFGKFRDQNGKYYDLRVENGGGDPRVHVAVTAKWGRDVDVHRHVVVFRTGLLSHVAALDHDYQFRPVDEEFINSSHTPNVVRLGRAPAAFTAVGRTGVDGLTVRTVEEEEGRWDVEFEVHHYESEPLVAGDSCDTADLDGVARVPKSTKFEMRADLVLGIPELPVGLRYPSGRRAAVALVEPTKNGTARVVTTVESQEQPTVEAKADESVWFGESVAALPCKEGRFTALARRGYTAAWSGHELSAGRDVFVPSEADARRAVAFHHPNAPVDPDTPFTLFGVMRAGSEKAAPWLSAKSLADLRAQWGAIVVATDLDAVMKADASATKTVADSLNTVARDETVWVTSVGELGDHLIAVGDVEYDFLPEGVVRVRNPELVDIEGLSLLLPPGVTARYMPGTEHQSAGRVTSFDLGGRREQLLQLYRGDEPFETMTPARVTVKWDRPASPTETDR